MRAWRARNQLETEMAQVLAARKDELHPVPQGLGAQPEDPTPDWVDGYWYGRYHGLREAIYLAKQVENHDENL